jgi:hypothetical protein
MVLRRAVMLLIAVALVGCTATGTTSSGETTPSGSTPPNTIVSPSETTVPAGATLADGSALPSGCHGKAAASQTVSFVAQGRAWALDPTTDGLSCLFRVGDPGSFAFGPQGDRVLLADLSVRGLSAAAPTWPATGRATPSVFDWGHPLGLAIVYADASGVPRKRFMDDGNVEKLTDLPKGRYQAIAYHPSGLALGFIVDQGARQGIWISTNEGKDPQRLVFSRPDTVFSSLAFSPDGQRIWWIAQHAGAISEIHWMDLADRSGFSQVLSRGLSPTAHGLLLAPSGSFMAATQGQGCADQQAMVVDTKGAHPAAPGVAQPTHALGWLDASTLLVAAGDCGQPTQLYAVHWGAAGSVATLLVSGVDIGASRTVLHDAPTDVPAPAGDATPAPPGGVG